MLNLKYNVANVGQGIFEILTLVRRRPKFHCPLQPLENLTCLH